MSIPKCFVKQEYGNIETSHFFKNVLLLEIFLHGEMYTYELYK